jgi:DNA-binding transcriptional LysR family regulator
LARVLPQYPDLHIEMHADYRLTDIAADRYDIGVRYGDQVENDMIAVRLTEELPLVIVGSPAYFAWHKKPTTVQELLKHNCLTLRLATRGGIYAWELEHEGNQLEARVRGQVICSNASQMVNAALSGNGLAFVTETMVGEHLRLGRLLSVMPEWCGAFPALHAYYPSRRHSSRVMGIVIDAIRYKADGSN